MLWRSGMSWCVCFDVVIVGGGVVGVVCVLVLVDVGLLVVLVEGCELVLW